jgi:hypothetical protein
MSKQPKSCRTVGGAGAVILPFRRPRRRRPIAEEWVTVVTSLAAGLALEPLTKLQKTLSKDDPRREAVATVIAALVRRFEASKVTFVGSDPVLPRVLLSGFDMEYILGRAYELAAFAVNEIPDRPGTRRAWSQLECGETLDRLWELAFVVGCTPMGIAHPKSGQLVGIEPVVLGRVEGTRELIGRNGETADKVMARRLPRS